MKFVVKIEFFLGIMILLLPYAAFGKTAHGKSILDLQNHMSSDTIDMVDQKTSIRLVNLNTHADTWYLYEIITKNNQKRYSFHLESPSAYDQSLFLDKSFPQGIIIRKGDVLESCPLLGKDGSFKNLLAKKRLRKPFVGLCGDRVFLRNQVPGEKSHKEWAVEFIRDNIWGGETFTSLVKNTIYKDKFILNGEEMTSADKSSISHEVNEVSSSPEAISIAPVSKNIRVRPSQLGFKLNQEGARKGLRVGQWYPVKGSEDVFLSMLRPKDIHADIMNSYKNRVKPLDSTEKSALVYLVAVDLSQYRLGYSLGTEHPRLNWSARTPRTIDRRGTPGPDGIIHSDPIVRSGLVNPIDRKKVVMTFTGGFKRMHGAFRWGPLSTVNNASHYGFVENGIVFSRLNPKLATVMIDNNGRFSLTTWGEHDTVESRNVRHARQNGFPIIQYDRKFNKPVPHPSVDDGLRGNWSADYYSVQRTLRAGICTLEREGKRYMIYGYFSSATANSMARVFQACKCDYAMHLDMNLLEHTYLAHYIPKKGVGMVPRHLVKGMAKVDKKHQGRRIPRFLGVPDNRDFFYLMRKDQQTTAH